MSDTIDRNASPYYDEPGFYKSPPASSLPIPTFNKRSSTGSGVSTQLSLGEPKSPSDATSHIKQVSSDSKEISTKRKSVSFNSDTKSHDGKRAKSATKDQDKFIDMIQKSRANLMASAKPSVAFESLVKRTREDNEAQAKRETVQHRTSEIFELRRRLQAIIDRIEQKPTKVTLGYTPQELIAIRDRNPIVATRMQRQAREIQRRQEMRHYGNHMLQRATGMLGQNLAEQQETLQERLDGINEEIRQGKGNMADDEISLISSSDGDSLTSVDDESTQIDVEIDRYEYQDRAVILPSNLRLALSFQGTGFVESEETAVDDESEADQDMPGIEETEEFDDEGYCSMEDE